jgi:PAS domain S-box-containing protein
MVISPDAELFRLMVSRVRDYAIFLLDPKGRIISWNAGARAIKQYTDEEIIGREFSIFYTQPDIDRGWPAHELKCALTEGRFEDEGWRVRKDGSRFWANVIITALRDDSGVLRAFSKITRDLTDKRLQQESLRLSEERFRLLVEGVQDYAIYLLSPDGVVTSWNAGARRIKGYEASEIIGSHFSRFYPPDDIESGKPWAELAMAREHGRAEDEGWRIRKDGSRFWSRVVVTPLFDPNGSLHGFAKVTQDLTQRRHSEALELSSQNVQQFLAVLAHELRNPLAAIRNAVQLQKALKPGDAGQEMAYNVLNRQTGQLTRIVEDLMDISRVARGSLSIDRKPSDVAVLVARAIETARPNIEAANHTLEVSVPPELIRIDGDELRLTQALTNIINNAARYTDRGGKITVAVTRTRFGESPGVRIAVRDTGRGIEASLLPNIFGMFVQGKNLMNRPVEGLGVGLALARSIVELHHGTLEAHSEGAGKGAEFVIALPAITGDVEADTGKRQIPAAIVAVPSPAQEKRRVLVVDDNQDAAITLASLLRTFGHEVVTVHDGVEALQTSEGFRPQVVLLDIGMPGMDGLEVARRLRKRNRLPRPLIVAVTGWGKQEDEALSKEAGFDFHVVKPVEESQLREIFGRPAGLLH